MFAAAPLGLSDKPFRTDGLLEEIKHDEFAMVPSDMHSPDYNGVPAVAEGRRTSIRSLESKRREAPPRLHEHKHDGESVEQNDEPSSLPYWHDPGETPVGLTTRSSLLSHRHAHDDDDDDDSLHLDDLHFSKVLLPSRGSNDIDYDELIRSKSLSDARRRSLSNSYGSTPFT